VIDLENLFSMLGKKVQRRWSLQTQAELEFRTKKSIFFPRADALKKKYKEVIE